MTSLFRDAIERAGQFVYNARTAYYEYASDLRQVGSDQLVQVAERRVADSVATMDHLLVAYRDGDISLTQWRDGMATELRRSTSQLYALGRGGWQQVTNEDRAAVTERLKAEFGYLRQFASELASGDLSEAQVRARMGLYAEHTRAAFWEGQRAAKDEAGYTRERRVLSAAEHCGDCESMANEDWREIGYFPPPGEGSQCMANCKCEMEFA